LRGREWQKDLQSVGTRSAVSCAETRSSYKKAFHWHTAALKKIQENILYVKTQYLRGFRETIVMEKH